jgi:hypothetical protein
MGGVATSGKNHLGVTTRPLQIWRSHPQDLFILLFNLLVLREFKKKKDFFWKTLSTAYVRVDHFCLCPCHKAHGWWSFEAQMERRFSVEQKPSAFR